MAFVPRSIAPFERYPKELAGPRVSLGQLLDHHVPLASRFVGAGHGNFYAMDVWLIGVARRSFHLVEGFLQAFDAWNVTVAAPIVRMQIDSLVRTSYVLQAEGGEAIAVKLMAGKQLRAMTAHDDPSKRLSDAELVRRAELLFPWLKPVYDKSNEWVHLSERHIWNATRLKKGSERTIEGHIPLPPDWIPVSFLVELIGVMQETTASLFGMLEHWEERKDERAHDGPGDESGSAWA